MKISMKTYREELWFNTKTRRDYINISGTVQKIIDKSGIKEGLCLVNAMHIRPAFLLTTMKAAL